VSRSYGIHSAVVPFPWHCTSSSSNFLHLVRTRGRSQVLRVLLSALVGCCKAVQHAHDRPDDLGVGNHVVVWDTMHGSSIWSECRYQHCTCSLCDHTFNQFNMTAQQRMTCCRQRQVNVTSCSRFIRRCIKLQCFLTLSTAPFWITLKSGSIRCETSCNGAWGVTLC
jgi:hypothetical protein